MSLKDKAKKLLSSRNVLIILVVICIIIAAYILITNYSGESEEALSVRDVLNQSDDLIKTGEKITVKGYYSPYNNTIARVTDSAVIPGSIPSDYLFVDHSGVDVDLVDNTNYLFTGVLEKYPLNPNLIILKASEIEQS